MKKTKLLLYLIIMLSVSLMIWGCKSYRDAHEELENSGVIEDIIETAAKYVGYNVSKDTYAKGVYKVSIQGTQAFDPYYWGFDGGAMYFLENSNKTLSYYQTVSSPYPDHITAHSFNKAFADGTLPDKIAYSGVIYPVRVTARTETNYNGSGTALNSHNYWKWAVEYDSTTGNPTTHTLTFTSAATDTPVTQATARYVYTYAAENVNPGYSNFYSNSDAVYDYDGTSFTRTRKKTISKTGTWSWTAEDTTTTTTCYGADDDTKATTCWLTNSAHKTIETTVMSGTSKTRTIKYYNTSDVEFSRQVETYEYENVARYHYSSYSKKSYSVVSDGTATLTYQQDKTYAKGHQIDQTDYSVAAGIATMTTTRTYTRDSQGRATGYYYKDADGNPTRRMVYTFDGNGTLASIREYGYTNGVQNSTPSCWGFNSDYSYARDSTGVTEVSVLKYCNGSTYIPTGYQRLNYVYNAKGLQTRYQNYIYSGTTTTLILQVSYEYDENGNKTKQQNYTVSGGTATANTYTTYSYDTNLYRVTTKNYNSNDELQTLGWSGSCAANPSETCYTTASYTYK